MTLLAPIALSTIAILATVLGALTITAYFLRMRRRRFEVPFSMLWARVLKNRESTALWKQLRRWLSLALLLFILGLLVFAATEPRIGDADRASENVVLIIDASASMQATDGAGGRSRMEVARERATHILNTVSSGSNVMLLQMDGQATPLTRFSDDMALHKRRVETIKASDTPADLRAALQVARDALRERERPTIIVVGDGAYPEDALRSVVFEPRKAPKLDDIDLSGIDFHFVSVGKAGANVGIVAFNVRRYITNKLSYEVFIEVQNFGKDKAERQLTLQVDGDPIQTDTLTLAPGQRVRKLISNLGGNTGTELLARLEPLSGQTPDVFALDDTARALLPEQRQQKVLLVTEDNLYLEGAMLVYENVRYEKLKPADYAAKMSKDELGSYDTIIFDGVTPELVPDRGHLLYLGTEGARSPFVVTSTLRAPAITAVNEEHPVMRWLVLKDVNFEASQTFAAAPGVVALASSVRSPIIVAKREAQRKTVATGFKLTSTDLTLRAAFPLFLVNVFEWFSGDDTDLITTYSTGQRIDVPIDETLRPKQVLLTTPSGHKLEMPALGDHAAVYTSEVGKYELAITGASGQIARTQLVANLGSSRESAIEPFSALSVGNRTIGSPEGLSLTPRPSMWKTLVILAGLLLCIEWVTYHRRVTV